MDESINSEGRWIDEYVESERRYVYQFFVDIPAAQALQYSLAQERIRQSLAVEENAFKDLLNKARAAFPPEKQLAFRINALNLSESEKETIFQDYYDQITHSPPSIPIVYSIEQAGKQYTELWDLPGYLDYLLIDDLKGDLGDMLELRDPYTSLQDNRAWETDDAKWNILVKRAAKKAHQLKNPKTLQSISCENLRLPNDEDLASINRLIKHTREKNTAQLATVPI